MNRLTIALGGGMASGVVGTITQFFAQAAPTGGGDTILTYAGAIAQLGAVGILGLVAKLLLSGSLVPRDVAAANAKLAQLAEKSLANEEASQSREKYNADLVDRLLAQVVKGTQS